MLFVCYDLPDLRRGCVIEKNNCVLLQKIMQINLAGDVYNFRFLSQKLRRTFTILCTKTILRYCSFEKSLEMETFLSHFLLKNYPNKEDSLYSSAN